MPFFYYLYVYMNNIVDNIYVINMKKDVKKLQCFQNQCHNLFTYEIIEGVDVLCNKYKSYYDNWIIHQNNIKYENFNWEYYLNRYNDLQLSGIDTKLKAWNHYINYGKNELRSCNPICDIINTGQLGCLLSHINILKDAINKRYKNILILEDDIIITESFTSRLNDIKNVMKDDWKIIYLGAGQHNWNNIDLQNNYYIANNSTGTFAYMVNSSFYEELLIEYEKLNKPVDNYLINFQKYNSIKILYPNIIYCDLENSNISNKRDNKIWFEKFKWNDI